MSKMTMKTEGDTHLIVTRRFSASPEALLSSPYRAGSDSEMVAWTRRLGPCPSALNEAKPGGKFRYEWTNGKGAGFHITGEYLQLEPYDRIVHVERMHLPDPTPDKPH